MIDQNKRTLLKGLSLVAAVPIPGFSAIALTKPSGGLHEMGSALPTCDLTIYQQQTVAKEVVTLMNLTGEKVTLDEITPVGLSDISGSLQVKVNVKKGAGAITLQPGERLSFDIEATTAQAGDKICEDTLPNVIAGRVKIRSDHPAFNGMIPITAFDAQLTN